MTGQAKVLHQCSFCGKSQLHVRKLINGNDVYICNECVDLCHSILAQDEDTTQIAVEKKITPEIIKAYLDERIIGQNKAKIILSVAIYNHLQRVDNPIVDGVELDKSNLLFVGPSGSGKCISSETKVRVKVPKFIADFFAKD